MAKTIAIIIATATDGTLSIVGGADGLMSRSDARTKLREIVGEDLAKVELFDLRQPSKRRKLNRATEPAPPNEDTLPTFDEIAEKLASGEVVIPEDGLKNDGSPKVKAVNDLFGVKLDGKAVAELWAKVEEMKNRPPQPHEIAEKLASGEVVIPEDDMDEDGVPFLDWINEKFGVEIDETELSAIWETVQKIKAG